MLFCLHTQSTPIHTLQLSLSLISLFVTPSLHSSLIPIPLFTLIECGNSTHIISSMHLNLVPHPVITLLRLLWSHKNFFPPVLLVSQFLLWYCHPTQHRCSFMTRSPLLPLLPVITCGLRSGVIFSDSAHFCLLSSLQVSGDQWMLTCFIFAVLPDSWSLDSSGCSETHKNICNPSSGIHYYLCYIVSHWL